MKRLKEIDLAGSEGLQGLQVYNIPTLNDDVLDFMVPVPSVFAISSDY